MKTLQSILITFLFMATTMNAQVQKKTLVAYYSWSGNTKVVAEYIQAATNAEIFRIEPVKKYAKDYRTCCDVVKEEINKGYHPELTAKVENLAQYDTIYIGTPNWWSTMAPLVATFLASYDFKGKTVIAFKQWCSRIGAPVTLKEGNIPESDIPMLTDKLLEVTQYWLGGETYTRKMVETVLNNAK